MSTTQLKPGRTRHPLVNIAEWRKGCSCAPKDHPVQCEQCTEGLIKAVEDWFTEHRNTRISGIASVLENLDARAGESDKPVIASRAAAIIRHLEAELYAVDDQVAGLQELMAAQNPVPPLLDAAVRALVRTSDEDDIEGPSIGSPRHGHQVAGLWDGDGQHPKGSTCEECAAWTVLREYVKTDVVAKINVVALAAKPVDIWALPVDLVIDINAMPHGLDTGGRNPREMLAKLGIQWQRKEVFEATAGMGVKVHLFGCTNVPVELPDWIVLKQVDPFKRVDLILDMNAFPAILLGNPSTALARLGITWDRWQDHSVADQVHLLDCRNVPAQLPQWLKVKK